MRIHTIFSIENIPYHRWQATLLQYSFSKVGQPGPLTCLVSGRRPAPIPLARTFHTETWNPHPKTGDPYPPYNKPAAICAWLREDPPEDDLILVIDPDCVFLAPVEMEASPGRPFGQRIPYLVDDGDDWSGHCERPWAAQPIGIPILIHRDDLARLAPLWLRKTEEIRADDALRERAGWIAEMWGYALAAADLGLDHRLVEIAATSLDDRTDLPLVHYCYDVESHGWSWSKRTYDPWRPVREPPPTVPAATAAVTRVLNEITGSAPLFRLRANRGRAPAETRRGLNLPRGSRRNAVQA